MTLAERSRYAPAMLLAVVLAGVGVVAGNPVALFAAVIPLALVGYGALVVEPPYTDSEVEAIGRRRTRSLSNGSSRSSRRGRVSR